MRFFFILAYIGVDDEFGKFVISCCCSNIGLFGAWAYCSCQCAIVIQCRIVVVDERGNKGALVVFLLSP